MKKLLFCVALISGHAFGQVGIGTNAPNATLEVVGKPTIASEMDGFIPPKITLQQLSAKTGYGSNQTGAVVYVTSVSPATIVAATAEVNRVGYYHFDGVKWRWMSPTNMTTGVLYPPASNTGAYGGLYDQWADITDGSFILPEPGWYEISWGITVQAGGSNWTGMGLFKADNTFVVGSGTISPHGAINTHSKSILLQTTSVNEVYKIRVKTWNGHWVFVYQGEPGTNNGSSMITWKKIR
ncbi:MAG: hypothetical protein FJX95_02810 [Bacteroidetes bacterium]|nr:hypothetical protein [Bacteroidota bacterium]